MEIRKIQLNDAATLLGVRNDPARKPVLATYDVSRYGAPGMPELVLWGPPGEETITIVRREEVRLPNDGGTRVYPVHSVYGGIPIDSIDWSKFVQAMLSIYRKRVVYLRSSLNRMEAEAKEPNGDKEAVRRLRGHLKDAYLRLKEARMAKEEFVAGLWVVAKQNVLDVAYANLDDVKSMVYNMLRSQ